MVTSVLSEIWSVISFGRGQDCPDTSWKESKISKGQKGIRYNNKTTKPGKRWGWRWSGKTPRVGWASLKILTDIFSSKEDLRHTSNYRWQKWRGNLFLPLLNYRINLEPRWLSTGCLRYLPRSIVKYQSFFKLPSFQKCLPRKRRSLSASSTHRDIRILWMFPHMYCMF